MTRRLLIAYLSITAFALVVVVIPLGLTFASRERDRLSFYLERDAVAVASQSEDSLEAGHRPDLHRVFANYHVAGGRIVVVDAAGRSVADSAAGVPLGRDFATRPEIAAALHGDRVSGRRHSRTLHTDLVYVAIPVASSATVHGAVRITLSSSAVDARVRATWIRLGALSAIVLAAVGIIGLLLARSVTRPVRQLEDAAKRLAAGDLDARVGSLDGAPELVALGQQFDSTAERLSVLVDGQRRFVADASHQLRTPLTALRLRLEALQPSADDQHRVDAALAETDRLALLVQSLLVLARAEAAGPDLTTVDLAEIARGRLDTWHPVAAARSITIDLRTPDHLLVHAVAGAGEQILDNLVSNAVAAVPDGTTITIEVAAEGDGGLVQVTDEGPGMSEAQRAEATERFWRSPGSQSKGFGLGLAIVAQLAGSSGGRVELDAGPRGRGLQVTVHFVAPILAS